MIRTLTNCIENLPKGQEVVLVRRIVLNIASHSSGTTPHAVASNPPDPQNSSVTISFLLILVSR